MSFQGQQEICNVCLRHGAALVIGFVSMCMLKAILSYESDFVGVESSDDFSMCSMLVHLSNVNCTDRFPGLVEGFCSMSGKHKVSGH